MLQRCVSPSAVVPYGNRSDLHRRHGQLNIVAWAVVVVNTAFTLTAFADKIHRPLYGRGAGSGSNFKYPTNAKSCQQVPIRREERHLLFSAHSHRLGILRRQVCIY
jgi:hypothetical protein